MDEESYKNLWKVPFYHKPDMLVYLDKVLDNYDRANLPPPDYLETKKILENKYGYDEFIQNKGRVRGMLWRDHRVAEVQKERERLNLPPVTVYGGRKIRKGWDSAYPRPYARKRGLAPTARRVTPIRKGRDSAYPRPYAKKRGLGVSPIRKGRDSAYPTGHSRSYTRKRGLGVSPIRKGRNSAYPTRHSRSYTRKRG